MVIGNSRLNKNFVKYHYNCATFTFFISERTCEYVDMIQVADTELFVLNLCSELELKPVGKLTVTIVRANDLKNMELIGKSDPYVVLHIRPLFKVKTKVVDNNLNPVWNQTFDLIAEDKETQSLIFEVFNLSTLCFSSRLHV